MESVTEPQGKLGAFAKTTYGKNILLGGAAILVAAVMMGVWAWGQQPEYRVLFSNYNDRDGGAIIAALQQMNVPYKYAEGGGAILVPAANVHDARLRLASQGLPKGGNVGFELMERQRLGISQFGEQVNFQRALEGELATSIESVSAVQSARVHLALPKPSVFVREQQKPTASVLLNLFPGRSLDAQQLAGIVHLVSSSVPDLPPANVSIIDQTGNLLSDTKAPGAHNLDATQLKYVEDLQRSIVKRIESIIAPIMGEQNVRAEVTADVDFSRVESANETFEPNQAPNTSAIRSQQTQEQTNNAGGASGVPGALTNTPPAPATAPLTTPPTSTASTQTPGGTVHKEATTNYEVDKTVKYTQQAVGGIKRLSVAVVVNYKLASDKKGKTSPRALTEDEKAQITSLAKEAMGFNSQRGDTINVVNSAFAGVEKEVVAPPTLTQRFQDYVVANPVEFAKYCGSILAVLALFFGVLLPIVRRLTGIRKPAPATTSKPEEPSQPASLAGVSESETDGEPAVSEPAYQQKLNSAREIAEKDPRIVANVITNWVGINE
jgi:flagellar M-ring protein FliF